MTPSRRNAGPEGGYRAILLVRRLLPAPLFDVALRAGSLVSLACMPAQRRASRDYLRCALGRAPRRRDVWSHFHAFARVLVLRLCAGAGQRPHMGTPEVNGEPFMALIRSGRPALYGTFHLGCSDLLGFVLAGEGCRVAMVRLKVGNSHDTDLLSSEYAGVRILWVNDPADVLVGINAAVRDGHSIALQCDRHAFASRTEDFEFFGARRPFPVTVYHLAAIYRMPVAFCFAVHDGRDARLWASPVFEPEGSRQDVLAAGREHFAGVLRLVEDILREHPHQWFNFEAFPMARRAEVPA